MALVKFVSMLQAFESHIRKNSLFAKNQRLLLAFSGGLDSTVLVHLLLQCGFKPAIAHCNFQLRGKDSLEDEKFCQQLAKKNNLKFFTKRFDLGKYGKETGSNTQLAARNLRYEWFHEIISENNFDFILTAHHAGDIVETVIINLLRGTGINGLKGIPEKNGKLVRPLLPFRKEELEAYAKQHKIRYRTDQSNSENKYERNFIRNKIVPLLRELNPNLEDTFLRNTFHFQQEAGIVKEFLSNKAVDYTTQTHDTLFINRNRLRHERHLESILHHILTGYGFNGTQQRNIAELIRLGEGSGKIFRTSTHILASDRNDLILKEIPKAEPELVIPDFESLKKLPFFKVRKLAKFSLPKEKEFVVSADKLIFPLVIRSRKTGDRFRPFGMKGSKLLSDYMKEQKMNTFDKENCSILINGNNQIMWLMGFRSDDRYRVKGNEKDLLKLTIID